MMLDDHTSQILELKNIVNNKEAELQKEKLKTDKIKQKNDNTLSQMRNEFDEISSFIESQKSIISEHEETISSLTTQLNDKINDIIILESRIKESDEIIRLIRIEILELKNYSDKIQNETKSKNEELNNLKSLIDEINKTLVAKNNENKEILYHFDNYRDEKNHEIEILNNQLSEMKKDLLILIDEHENQKANLKMMFKFGRLATYEV